MPELKIQLNPLFATPIVAVTLSNAASADGELREAILRRRAEQMSVDRSNIGGWQSTHDLTAWGGPRAVELLTIAQTVATEVTIDADGKPTRLGWMVEAWANVNGPGDANSCHFHPESYWSGTYYVEDGGCGDNPSLAGEFEMFDPRGSASMMLAPALRRRGEGLSAGSAYTIRPRAGLMILFPSFLLHAVRAYRGNGLRISIAFNLAIRSAS